MPDPTLGGPGILRDSRAAFLCAYNAPGRMPAGGPDGARQGLCRGAGGGVREYNVQDAAENPFCA